jgi:hypothetical protein
MHANSPRLAGYLDERAVPVPLARPTSQSKPARRAASDRRALTLRWSRGSGGSVRTLTSALPAQPTRPARSSPDGPWTLTDPWTRRRAHRSLQNRAGAVSHKRPPPSSFSDQGPDRKTPAREVQISTLLHGWRHLTVRYAGRHRPRGECSPASAPNCAYGFTCSVSRSPFDSAGLLWPPLRRPRDARNRRLRTCVRMLPMCYLNEKWA